MKLTINYPESLTDNDLTAMLHAITTEWGNFRNHKANELLWDMENGYRVWITNNRKECVTINANPINQ